MRSLHPFVGALIAIILIAMAGLCASAIQLTPEQQKWPSANGVVTEVVHEGRMSNKETIQYEANGKIYTIDDIVAFGWTNQPAIVRYDPTSPDVAKRQPNWLDTVLSLPAFLGLIGLAFGFRAYRNWQRMGDEGRTWKISKFVSAFYLLLAVFFGFVFVSFKRFEAEHNKLAEAAKSWPIAPGTITNSDQSNDPTAKESKLAIRYKFSVDGKQYSGAAIDLSGLSKKGAPMAYYDKNDPDTVAEIAQNFRVGKSVEVHYNPANPNECALTSAYYWTLHKSGIDPHLRGFGTFDKTGRFRRLTNEIPNIIYEGYGWRLDVDQWKPMLHWKEELTDPAAPRYWGGGEKGLTQTISEDGRSCTSEGVTPTKKGYIQHYWTIAPNDPKGLYTMKVTIDGMPPKIFKFTVK
jgi:hypothetical protein